MTIPELSIRRPIFITCAFFLIMVVGFLSMMKLPIDLFPNVTFPVVVVSTPYPGAGPAEVETLVTKPIEDEVSTISGIETIRSVNREGLSTVIAEFSLQTDIKYAEQQIRDRVSSVRQNFLTMSKNLSFAEWILQINPLSPSHWQRISQKRSSMTLPTKS